MVDIPTLTAAATGIQKALEIINTAYEMTTQGRVKDKISELQNIISSIATDNLVVQSYIHEQQNTITKLETKLAQYRKWDETQSQYIPKKFPPDITVYVKEMPLNSTEKLMWFCANCYQNRHLSILQTKSDPYRVDVLYYCPNCKNELRIEPPEENRIRYPKDE